MKYFHILSIVDWNGIANLGNGPERLLFAGTTTDFTSLFNQADVSFSGFPAGYNAVQFSGFYEIVPVPEPSSVATVLGLLGLIGWRERRKREVV